jgi:hypothetical protein
MSLIKGGDSMKFQLEEKLPNLVKEGILNKIYTEIVTETKHKAKELHITGNLIITRELTVPNNNSEITIKNKFPIDITVPNGQKLVEGSEVCLHIKTFNLGLDKYFTEITGELELTNVVEKAKQLV